MNIRLFNFLFNLPFSNYISGFIKKKLIKNNNFYFIPTKKRKLPKNNYPIQNSIQIQKKIIENYNKNNQLSFNTFPHLKLILEKKFKSGTQFNFLDYGGENLDLYLDITKKFKNINYFLINLPEINQIMIKLKNENNYNNLIIINSLDEIKNYDYDFIFFGSCIHYVNNYDNLIKKILPNAKKHILFSATLFYNGNDAIKDIVVKQLNYMPKLYYLYFINLDFFIKLFEENNFKIEFNEKNDTSNFNMDTFKFLKIKNIKNSNILFSKSE